jgi:methyl-accepting chemotaxis protein
MAHTDATTLPSEQDGWLRRLNSLEWRLLAPIPVIVVIAAVLVWVVIPRVVNANSTNEAIRAGQQLAAQLKKIRAYYTENVVNKALKTGALKTAVDHRADDKAIPVPATLVHELSTLLTEKDTAISLYSKYPFPNRRDRVLDPFQQQAWDFLVANPGATFSRNEVRDGKQIVRVAVADTMAAACVNCHNSSPISPKTDWKLGDVRGVLEVASVIDSQLADGANLSRSIVVGAIVIGLILLGISLFAARSVTRPLRSMVRAMGTLASGKFDVELPGLGRKDEIGQMAKAVVVLRDAGIEKVRLEGLSAEQRQQVEDERRRNEDMQRSAAAEQARVVDSLANGLKSLSAGDLTFRLSDGFPDAYRQIREDFNAAIAQLQETIGAIALSNREVASTATEISSSTTDLSQRTEEQAASLEETSASMGQISATVKKNAESAQQANAFATATRQVADRGGGVVAQAVSAMARIEESSRKIAEIIGVIDEIARQTNLLALNAAVEAARAGEAGRGFAVVASEVRSLAQRSSQAAKDIKDLISNSSGKVQEGVELVNKAGASLTEIVESIKKVAEIVSDIATASGEQSTGIDQVNAALNQMDEVTQQNSALVEQNAAAAKALEQQSQGMGERVSFFRLDGAALASEASGQRGQSIVRAPDTRPEPGSSARGAQAAPAAATRGAMPTRSPTDSITMRKRYA